MTASNLVLFCFHGCVTALQSGGTNGNRHLARVLGPNDGQGTSAEGMAPVGAVGILVHGITAENVHQRAVHRGTAGCPEASGEVW